MNNYTIITAGCGKGKSCGIGSYVLPMGATKETFSKYVKEQLELMKEHSVEERIKET